MFEVDAFGGIECHEECEMGPFGLYSESNLLEEIFISRTIVAAISGLCKHHFAAWAVHHFFTHSILHKTH